MYWTWKLVSNTLIYIRFHIASKQVMLFMTSIRKRLKIMQIPNASSCIFVFISAASSFFLIYLHNLPTSSLSLIYLNFPMNNTPTSSSFLITQVFFHIILPHLLHNPKFKLYLPSLSSFLILQPNLSSLYIFQFLFFFFQIFISHRPATSSCIIVLHHPSSLPTFNVILRHPHHIHISSLEWYSCLVIHRLLPYRPY